MFEVFEATAHAYIREVQSSTDAHLVSGSSSQIKLTLQKIVSTLPPIEYGLYSHSLPSEQPGLPYCLIWSPKDENTDLDKILNPILLSELAHCSECHIEKSCLGLTVSSADEVAAQSMVKRLDTFEILKVSRTSAAIQC